MLSGGRLPDERLVNVGLAVVGVLFVLSGLPAIAGAVGGLLAGERWEVAPPEHWLDIAAGLSQRPGEPGSAFPVGIPAAALGPVLFWVAFALVCGASAGIVVFAVWVYRRLASQSSDRARWAVRRDLSPMAVPDDPARRQWRLVAGRHMQSRTLLAAEDCISAVALGPNGSGKTTGLLVPNVLEWDGPVVMTTTKSQDVSLVLARRQALGPVWVVAPAGCPGVETSSWSPVDYSVDEESADRMAEWLCEASGMGADPKARPWITQARKLVKPLLLAANVSGEGINGFVRWLYEGERAVEYVEGALLNAGHGEAAREYRSTWSIHEEGRGSVLFTAYGIADAYSRPAVRASAQRSDFSAADVVSSKPSTLIVVAPESDVDRHAPLLTALIASVVREAEVAAGRAGRPLEPRMLLALDEAANVFRFPRLPNLLTTARGNGIQLLLIYHDLAQVEQVYGGRQVARTILSNAKLRMLLPGVGDLETLRYFSEVLGRTLVERRSESRDTRGGRSTSRSDQHEQLAPLHVLQQLPDGQAIVQYQNLRPTRVNLRYCFRDPALRRLADGAGRKETAA